MSKNLWMTEIRADALMAACKHSKAHQQCLEHMSTPSKTHTGLELSRRILALSFSVFPVDRTHGGSSQTCIHFVPASEKRAEAHEPIGCRSI